MAMLLVLVNDRALASEAEKLRNYAELIVKTDDMEGWSVVKHRGVADTGKDIDISDVFDRVRLSVWRQRSEMDETGQITTEPSARAGDGFAASGHVGPGETDGFALPAADLGRRCR